MYKYFTSDAWKDYCYWQSQDKKTLKSINLLLKDIDRNGNDGIGKPEPLIGDLSGYWSRRIDDANRLVYKIEKDTIRITSSVVHIIAKSKKKRTQCRFFLYKEKPPKGGEIIKALSL